MGALYEDVENFFGDIFAWYGRKVARTPLVFVLVPLFACCLLGLGLFNIEYETDLENLYTPVNSRALRDRKLLREAFDGRGGGRHFYPHQAVDRPDHVELIIRGKDPDTDASSDGSIPVDYGETVVKDMVNGTDQHGDPVDILSETVMNEVGW